MRISYNIHENKNSSSSSYAACTSKREIVKAILSYLPWNIKNKDLPIFISEVGITVTEIHN